MLDDGDGPRAEAVGVGVRRWCCFCGVRSAASAAAVEEEEEWGIFYGLNRRKSIKKIIELALGGGSGLESIFLHSKVCDISILCCTQRSRSQFLLQAKNHNSEHHLEFQKDQAAAT